MNIRALIGVGLILLASVPVGAQRTAIAGPRPSALYVGSIPQDTATRQAVVYNWQEPTLIGGAVSGAFGNLFGYGFCDGSDTRSWVTDKCSVAGEMAFLTLGTIGGGIAGVIGSTSRPRVAPPGFEIAGDRRVYGALMLAAPSLAINAYGIAYQCRRNNSNYFYPSGTNGCNPGNVAFALLSAALNGWIGAQIGKGIPAYRKVE